MSNRKIAEEIAIIQAWIEQNRSADTPVASRRQRAYQIFNDEKAFDGKHGERLIRRMTEWSRTWTPMTRSSSSCAAASTPSFLAPRWVA